MKDDYIMKFLLFPNKQTDHLQLSLDDSASNRNVEVVEYLIFLNLKQVPQV